HVLRLWDWRTGELLRGLRVPSEARSVAFHPKGHEIAVLCDIGRGYLLDAATLKVKRSFDWPEVAGRFFRLGTDHYTVNGALRYSPDGERLYAYDIRFKGMM